MFCVLFWGALCFRRVLAQPPSLCIQLPSVVTAPFNATVPQAPKKTDAAAAAQLSSELFSFLTAGGAKPDDAEVMEKIEQLEVRSLNGPRWLL